MQQIKLATNPLLAHFKYITLYHTVTSRYKHKSISYCKYAPGVQTVIESTESAIWLLHTWLETETSTFLYHTQDVEVILYLDVTTRYNVIYLTCPKSRLVASLIYCMQLYYYYYYYYY